MASAPDARTAASLTYQLLTRQFLLFGGVAVINGGGKSMAETWLWNGQSWTKSNGAGPSARAYAVMDYDVARDKVILYGGQYDEAAKSPVSLFDMWLWDGVQWALNSSAPAPILRWPIGVYDVARSNFVLFGTGNSGPETWLWNGSQWSAAKPLHSPPAISGAGMAYVASTKQVVLFGGGGGDLGRVNDTWIWDGTDWRNPQLAPAPPARLSPTLVSGEQAILFGGGGNNGALADTWRWDGTAWAQLTVMHVPPARRAAASASDGQYLVVVGGDSAGVLSDGWRWDGTDWRQC
ncbi:MAG: hypothetical protein NVS1B3_08060 [Candidatus Dormibacteraceae bacterium]